ncbi:conjugal transfer protein TraO [Flavobacterium sp.]|uniref:conjugal transfer protein TraO n=1 Tax=Flavobacterium sp. TaxID=239 RepID=UPI0037500DC6
MKIKLIIASLFIGMASNAQQKSSSIDIHGGIVGKLSGSSIPIGIMAGYNYNTGNNTYEFNVLYSKFNDKLNESKSIEYNTIVLNIGYLRTIARNTSNSMAINLGAGFLGGLENIPSDNTVVITSKGGGTVGLYAVGNIDFIITDSVSIKLRGQQNYYILGTTGKFNPFIGLGISFNL